MQTATCIAMYVYSYARIPSHNYINTTSNFVKRRYRPIRSQYVASQLAISAITLDVATTIIAIAVNYELTLLYVHSLITIQLATPHHCACICTPYPEEGVTNSAQLSHDLSFECLPCTRMFSCCYWFVSLTPWGQSADLYGVFTLIVLVKWMMGVGRLIFHHMSKRTTHQSKKTYKLTRQLTRCCLHRNSLCQYTGIGLLYVQLHDYATCSTVADLGTGYVGAIIPSLKFLGIQKALALKHAMT